MYNHGEIYGSVTVVLLSFKDSCFFNAAALKKVGNSISVSTSDNFHLLQSTVGPCNFIGVSFLTDFRNEFRTCPIF